MRSASVAAIHSRDNAFVKDLRRLSRDSAAYRRQGRVWLEGEHLCRAALARGLRAAVAVFSEPFWPQAQAEFAHAADKTVVLAQALFAHVSALESPARMGFILDLPAPAALRPAVASVVLDRVQDAGNAGSILRSAAAFGFRQVLSVEGSAALWSPKVLRAGMGAHFALDLIENVAQDAILRLDLPLLVTSPHAGDLLHRTDLPWPCAWVLGHEGQGVAPALEARAALRIRIAQPGGEESLNVAAAAAICLHASGAGR
ncbi:RNA methyltransferase [Verminephrobacter aporrectodeae subsp. tuberculatae]|uniref:TrmH family RNA methyltransferase n=1 Tax=Verminephrobacter aporrectodeae TaxID=1110389 RepID=UPI0022377C5B|nr:RNA methyltransferase [Verminephrobacter aporrectodeae]MCW5255711.1 RNA methyltransferase [Verminephrobacter aporrectodeae subsp. tuberculatae]